MLELALIVLCILALCGKSVAIATSVCLFVETIVYLCAAFIRLKEEEDNAFFIYLLLGLFELAFGIFILCFKGVNWPYIPVLAESGLVILLFIILKGKK